MPSKPLVLQQRRLKECEKLGADVSTATLSIHTG